MQQAQLQFDPASGLRKRLYSYELTDTTALVVLSPHEKHAYKHCFQLADVDRDGHINTMEAVNFLRKSNLDKSHLATVHFSMWLATETHHRKIWNLVSKDNSRTPGDTITLSPLAFSLALRLVALAQLGRPLSFQEMVKVKGLLRRTRSRLSWRSSFEPFRPSYYELQNLLTTFTSSLVSASAPTSKLRRLCSCCCYYHYRCYFPWDWSLEHYFVPSSQRQLATFVPIKTDN